MVLVWCIVYMYVKSSRKRIFLDNNSNFLMVEDIPVFTPIQFLRLKQFGIVITVLGILLAFLSRNMDFRSGDWIGRYDQRADLERNVIFLVFGIIIAVIGVVMFVISLNQNKSDDNSRQKIE